MSNNTQYQGSKPTGKLGTFIGYLMNIFHPGFYKASLNKLSIQENAQILDIGCGGGKVIKILAEKITNGKIHGLDHSDEMVKLATKINADNIKTGKVTIKKGTVTELPYEDQVFDYVTALETIQFWPDLTQSLKQVYRVLKPNGQLVIINKFPSEGSKWWHFVQIKSENDYKQLLQQAGFNSIEADSKSKKGWITVIGCK